MKRFWRRTGLLLTAAAIIARLAIPAFCTEQEQMPDTGENLPGSGWQLYFGLLHAHTDISDGRGSVEEAFRYASGVEGLDFFAVTDHSNSFDNEDSGAIGLEGTAVSTEWAAGKAAAASVTDGDFVGIYGYEMTWRDSSFLGSINTFRTPGWQSRNQKGFSGLKAYYDVLTTAAGSVSQFNLPDMDTGEFENFAHWSEARDAAISLLEVGQKKGITAWKYYQKALEKGWHVAPTISQNNHNGQWGDESDVRTVILAQTLTEESLYEAMAARRVYATEDRDLQIRYTLNGQIMGSVTEGRGAAQLQIWLQDPTDQAVGRVSVIGGGEVLETVEVTASEQLLSLTVPGEYGYYYLRIDQPDGDSALTAPVWLQQLPEETQPPRSTTEPAEPKETEPEPAEPKETEPQPTEPKEMEPEPTKPAESQPAQPEETRPEETTLPSAAPVGYLPEDRDWEPYFGLLHAHTNLSDGTGSVEEAFSYASRVEGLDFFAVTDHSNSFDNAETGSITREGSTASEEWAAGKAAAAAVTGESFVGLFGYEMTWRDDRLLGHINTFATPGWISRNQEGYNTLTAYYEALTTVPGSIGQFNHPGPETGDFENFSRWTESYDNAMALLETGDGKGITAESGYIRALDKGWHVAPTVSQNNHNGRWGDADSGRTVILAERLTEQSLYEAMAARRVYATEDEDLELWYELDGQIMGSTIAAEQSHSVALWLRDGSEEDCLVEVITDGGAVVASAQTDGSVPLSLTVAGGGSYYYLRLTQNDGDIALTAPVWTVGTGNSGISGFTADTELPAAGEPLTLTLTVHNDSMKELLLEEVAVYAADGCIFRPEEPVSLAAGQYHSFTVPFVRETPGQAPFRAVVTGSSAGTVRTWEETVTIVYREKEKLSGILVDGSHGQTQSLENLGVLAEKAGMAMTVFTGPLPEGGEILVIPAPEGPFDEKFVEDAADFAREGGLLILCGGTEEASVQQNRILEAAGFTARFRQDEAVDPVRLGENSRTLHTAVYNRYTSLCRQIMEEQIYSHLYGSTVEPGAGIWLVKGQSTTISSRTEQTEPVLIAWEEQPGGGRVLAAGSCFLSDEAMPLPDNVWDPPRINQTLLQTLMGYEEERYEQDAIADVRKGTPGSVYRVAGYATSGTSNANTVFPDTLYLQDDTGGIALIPFSHKGIQTGTFLEVVGALEMKHGKPVLNPVSYRTPDQPAYQVAPEMQSLARSMDYANSGDRLVQIEATVSSVTLTEDGKGVSWFTLTDSRGDRAVVMVEAEITSGKFGVNNLAKKVKVGRTVRAIGIVDTDENGNSRLRVRNCDEVVHIPPLSLYNPFTGDPICAVAAFGLAALAAAGMLIRKLRRIQ